MTYDLVAYEVLTNKKEVLNWSNIAPTYRFGRGDEIVDGDTVWQVVGVRNRSTKSLWLVDVKRK